MIDRYYPTCSVAGDLSIQDEVLSWLRRDRRQSRNMMFKETHPILGTRDLERAIDFYVRRLGFQLKFRDGSNPTNYAGVRRDGVELHMQFQYEHEMSTMRLRLLVEDPDALYEEYRDKDVFYEGTRLSSTPWGTREFALYDPDRNALTFYRNLTPAERNESS